MRVPWFLERTRYRVRIFDGFYNRVIGYRTIYIDPDGREYVMVADYWHEVHEKRLPGRAGIYDCILNPKDWGHVPFEGVEDEI